MLFRYELNIYGFVGLIMLIGIVRKNAIMMIDFALEAQRKEGRSTEEAIYQGCLVRFRPIMMTTMSALMVRSHCLGHRRQPETVVRWSCSCGGIAGIANTDALHHPGLLHLPDLLRRRSPAPLHGAKPPRRACSRRCPFPGHSKHPAKQLAPTPVED